MYDDPMDEFGYSDESVSGLSTSLTTTATPIATTYFVSQYDVDIQIKAKDSMAYIESMSKEELVAFKNELSKVEKNIELEEQIDQLLDESDNIRRI